MLSSNVNIAYPPEVTGMEKVGAIELVWKLLAAVMDPEIPVLSIIDLGIVRAVTIDWSPENQFWQGTVLITPTYSGCPAMDVISMDIRAQLASHGFAGLKVEQTLSPAWTTDWMTENGKEKLKAYGIAPPLGAETVCSTRLFEESAAIQCPRCASYHTKRISQFGSTACKALYQCLDCSEPFDYFKCH